MDQEAPESRRAVGGPRSCTAFHGGTIQHHTISAAIYQQISYSRYYYSIPQLSGSLSSSDISQQSLWVRKMASSIHLSHTKHFSRTPSHSCVAIPSPFTRRLRISRWSRMRWVRLGLSGTATGRPGLLDVLAIGAVDDSGTWNVVGLRTASGFRRIAAQKGALTKWENDWV